MALPKTGSKYAALHEYLQRRSDSKVELSMGEIEAILCGPLPATARRGVAFWSNRRGGLQASAWLTAGFRVTHVDRRRRRVRFERPPPRLALGKKAGLGRWDGEAVRALREHLALNQQGLAEVLGVRQQTISEWETGVYAPSRGRSKHLDLVAERSDFGYGSAEQKAIDKTSDTV